MIIQTIILKMDNPKEDLFRRQNFVKQPWSVNTLAVLNTYYMALAIYGGLIGNLLSFLIFKKSSLKARISSFYMSALAASDFGYLFFISFEWISAIGINLTAFPGMCQITVFLTGSFATLSVWLTVSFTVERYLAICYPLWRLQMSTKGRARFIVSTLTVLSFILNSHFMLDVTTKPTSDKHLYFCEPDFSLELVLYYMNIIDTILTFCLPALLISVMNLMIARAIFVSSTRWKQQGLALKIRNSTDFTILQHLKGTSVSSQTQPLKAPTLLQLSVTRTLLLVSTVFLILNSPFYLTRIYLHLYIDKLDDHIRWVFVLQRYFMLLYYTHFSINFIIYNVSSTMFRLALLDYLRSNWVKIKKQLCVFSRINNRYVGITILNADNGNCNDSAV